MENFRIERGLREAHATAAAHLYYEAFRAKLNKALGPDDRAHAFLLDVFRTDHAICATSCDGGTLLGIAGFMTSSGRFVDGKFQDLARHYGWVGCLWRAPVLAVLEREIEDGRLVMDGIAVAAEARGRGVGTALLEEICNEAARLGKTEVRLDVIDSNERARVLYERRGFVAQGTEHLGPLEHVFGFAHATTMIRQV